MEPGCLVAHAMGTVCTPCTSWSRAGATGLHEGTEPSWERGKRQESLRSHWAVWCSLFGLVRFGPLTCPTGSTTLARSPSAFLAVFMLFGSFKLEIFWGAGKLSIFQLQEIFPWPGSNKNWEHGMGWHLAASASTVLLEEHNTLGFQAMCYFIVFHPLPTVQSCCFGKTWQGQIT